MSLSSILSKLSQDFKFRMCITKDLRQQGYSFLRFRVFRTLALDF